jgi:hypothetical protein
VFDSQRGPEVLLISTVSRPGLGPIQCCTQSMPCVLSRKAKRPGLEANNLSQSGAQESMRIAINTLVSVFKAWYLVTGTSPLLDRKTALKALAFFHIKSKLT